MSKSTMQVHHHADVAGTARNARERSCLGTVPKSSLNLTFADNFATSSNAKVKRDRRPQVLQCRGRTTLMAIYRTCLAGKPVLAG